MNDAQPYRMNAAECLSAAERCGPAYRDLTVSIAETWLALVRHEDAMDELLATWNKASSLYQAGSLFTPDLHRPPLAGPCSLPGYRGSSPTSAGPEATVSADYGMIRC
jgi:hypothetical protein